MNAYNVQNIIASDGISISITGMLIVFVGLILISSFIVVLPRILAWGEDKQQSERDHNKVNSASVTPGQEDAIISSLIGLVLHLELEQGAATDQQKITISQPQDQRSKWGSSGKMREIPIRRTHA